MPDYALFTFRVTTLTPLHIGSGETLMNDYDYAIHQGKTWRIDHAALLEAQPVDDLALAEQLAVTPPANLLGEQDYAAGSPYFRYVINGTPRAKGEGAILREALKDVYDRPYLPGSSLKGALRTALGWQLWKAAGMHLELRNLIRNPKFAAQRYEEELFGATPNRSFLRALQIGDSQPVSPERLMVVNVRVMNRGNKPAPPVEVEAVRPDTTFELNVKVDLALFSEWARRAELKQSGLQALEKLPEIINARSAARARRDAAWFSALPNAKRLVSFYQQTLPQAAVGGRFVLSLGWGTGWEDKTFGERLKEDLGPLDGAIHQFHLDRDRRIPAAEFPISRRVAVGFMQQPDGARVETPAVPMGWVMVEIEALSQASELWQTVPAGLAKDAAPQPAQPAPIKPPPAQSAQVKAPPPTRQAQPAKPTRPPEAARPVAPVISQSFSNLPHRGDRFYGAVMDCEPSGRILLEIPGLSADDVASAVIPPEENPSRRKFSEGKRVLCEVIRLQKVAGGLTDVICRMEE